MLQQIRDKSKSWLSVLLISIIILSFALWGIQRLFMSTNTSAPVAKVFSTKINQADLSTEYERLRRQAQINLGSRFFSDAALPTQLKQQALENLVLVTAMSHATEKEGYRVGTTLVGSMIGVMPIFQENGQFSQKLFLERVNEMGYTPESFFQLAQQSLITQQIKSGMVGTSFILPDEMKQAEDQLFQERQFNYLIISPDFFSGQANISDSDMRLYYQQHQRDFQLPEQVSIEYVELSATGLSDKQLKEKSAQLSDLNDEHPNSLVDLAKAAGLTIQTTDLFQRSDVIKTGILANPSVIQSAFSDEVLQQKNNSELIELSDHSVVILRVKDYQAPTEKSYAVVAPHIKDILAMQWENQQAQRLGERIVAQANDHHDLNVSNHLQWVISPYVARDDKTIPAEVLQTAFLMPLPSAKQYSVSGVSLSDQGYAVILLKSVRSQQLEKNSVMQKNTEQALEYSEGQTAYQLYQQKVLDEAAIKYYAH